MAFTSGEVRFRIVLFCFKVVVVGKLIMLNWMSHFLSIDELYMDSHFLQNLMVTRTVTFIPPIDNEVENKQN